MRAIVNRWTSHEPSLSLFHFEGLQEELDHPRARGFFGDFQMKGGLVDFVVFYDHSLFFLELSS